MNPTEFSLEGSGDQDANRGLGPPTGLPPIRPGADQPASDLHRKSNPPNSKLTNTQSRLQPQVNQIKEKQPEKPSRDSKMQVEKEELFKMAEMDYNN